MKKICSAISLILIVGILLFTTISWLSPSILKNIDSNFIDKISSIYLILLLSLLLISRSALLLQRDTKTSLAKVGMSYSLLYILIMSLINFEVITNSSIINPLNYICTGFLIILLMYTFIFEVNSTNSIVIGYQYIIAILYTLLVIYNTINNFNDSININSLQNVGNLAIIIVLLMISIPIVNLLFESNIREINDIDIHLQELKMNQSSIQKNAPLSPLVENPIETASVVEQTIIPEAFDIPFISTPVSINDSKKEETAQAVQQSIIPEASNNSFINTPVQINDSKKEESNNINPSL